MYSCFGHADCHSLYSDTCTKGVSGDFQAERGLCCHHHRSEDELWLVREGGGDARNVEFHCCNVTAREIGVWVITYK